MNIYHNNHRYDIVRVRNVRIDTHDYYYIHYTGQSLSVINHSGIASLHGISDTPLWSRYIQGISSANSSSKKIDSDKIDQGLFTRALRPR